MPPAVYRKGEAMTRQERVSSLIDYLKKENDGYESIMEPVNYHEKRNLLRSLMNVRWPGEALPEYFELQDGLLKDELKKKGIVRLRDIPVVADEYPCSGIKNGDRISIWQGDITRLAADAIVNAANSQMLGCFVPCHGCIDNAIHSAAGIQLRLECSRIMETQKMEEPMGKAKITRAYNLPCHYVLHTVGPIIYGEVTQRDRDLLSDCYRSCLELAAEYQLKSIAFCCISTGEFHFPNEEAAEIAIQTVKDYQKKNPSDMEVIFNVFKDCDYKIYKQLLG